jgi:hypothetical protein
VVTSRAVLLPPPPHPRLIIRFLNNLVLQCEVRSLTLNPNLEDQGVPLCLPATPSPVGMGDPTSSYAAAGIALGVSGALGPTATIRWRYYLLGAGDKWPLQKWRDYGGPISMVKGFNMTSSYSR